MDYKKTLCFYEDDGETIMFKFDIVLNRAIAFQGLKEFPLIADVFINGINNVNDGGNNKNDKRIIYESIINGNAEKIFAANDEMPKLIAYLFPVMLEKGHIEKGKTEDILALVDDLVYDDEFVNAMTDFFMQALCQKEKRPARKVKFSMK